MIKRNTIAAVIALGLVLALGAGRMSAQSGYDLFQKALAMERADGNLAAAIPLYQRIVKEFAADRALTAKTLLRLGECYQMLGDTQARAVFERLTGEFADQKQEAGEARARLASLRQPAVASPVMVTRRIWTVPSNQTVSTVSYDGRYVSYVDWDNGDLFVRDLSTGTARRLTTSGNNAPGTAPTEIQYAEDAIFSRDGKQLVYSWFRGDTNRYDLRVMKLEGSAVPSFRRLYENDDADWVAPSHWSADHKTIAIQIGRKDRTRQIGLLDAATGSVRVLKSVEWLGPTNMFFSPDGRYLAYDLPNRDTSQQRDVFVLAIDGSREEVAAVVHPSDDTITGWSPDGGRLVFVSDRGGSRALWTLGFKAGETTGIPELVKSEVGQGTRPLALTALGGLYYHVRAADSGDPPRIQVATFDFGTLKFVSTPIDINKDYFQATVNPQWSPDGKHLVYVSRRPSGSAVLAFRSVETDLVSELRPQLAYLNAFTISPDGQSILATARDFKGRQGIYRIDVRTGEASPVVISESGGDVGSPSWSPDAKSFFYRRRISNSQEVEFVQRDVNSGNERVVSRRLGLGGINLSPDGRYIMTGTGGDLSDEPKVLLISTESGRLTELMRTSRGKQRQAGDRWFGVTMWAPDSQSIVIRKRSLLPTGASHYEMFHVPVDGTPPRRIDANINLGINPHDFRVHPDGRRVAFHVGVEAAAPTSREVWLVENLLTRSPSGR